MAFHIDKFAFQTQTFRRRDGDLSPVVFRRSITIEKRKKNNRINGSREKKKELKIKLRL